MKVRNLKQLRPAERKRYKVLQNGVRRSDFLIKKKNTTGKLQKIIKRNNERLHFKRYTLNKIRTRKPVPKNKFKPLSGFIKKNGTAVKDKILSQRADISKQGDTGAETTKLGLQFGDYAQKGINTTKSGISSSVNGIRKISKPIANKVTNGITKRKTKGLQTAVKKTVRNTKNTVKSTARTIKTAQKATKVSANALKAAQEAVKKTVQVTVKAISAIMSIGFPYNIVVILVIVVSVAISLTFTSVFSTIGGTITGGAGWVINDSNTETDLTDSVVENYKEYIEETKLALQNSIRDTLSGNVESFCETTQPNEPKRILEYNGSVYYPAPSGKNAVLKKIEDFTFENYVDFFSVMFVILTREKQKAEGTDENEIYDFDFKREDIENFMGQINQNIDTYLYKTSEITHGHTCPGADCKRKTRSHCYCSYYFDENGDKVKYCGGHPYCPSNHTKLTINLYEMSEYMKDDIMNILNFTDTERIKAELSKEIITKILEENDIEVGG